MSLSDLLPQPRGVDRNLPTCGETRCNSHGTCEMPPGGGATLVCNCRLGYQGEFCEDTVNGSLSLPLTLSVLAVIIGLLLIGFIFAKLRQKQQRQRSSGFRSVSAVQQSTPAASACAAPAGR